MGSCQNKTNSFANDEATPTEVNNKKGFFWYVQLLNSRIYSFIWRDRAFLMLFTMATLISTSTFGKSAFILHAAYVTHTLLSVLVDVEEIYKNVQIPFNNCRRFIITTGVLHLINPCLMLYSWKWTYYLHLPICFSVHIFHLSYVRFVYRAVGYNDAVNWNTLMLLNFCEFVTNLIVMQRPQMYSFVAIATESICPFVLTFRKKKVVYKQRLVRSTHQIV